MLCRVGRATDSHIRERERTLEHARARTDNTPVSGAHVYENRYALQMGCSALPFGRTPGAVRVCDRTLVLPLSVSLFLSLCGRVRSARAQELSAVGGGRMKHELMYSAT